MTEPTVWCQLCTPPRRVAAAALLEHFRVVHDFDEDIATWPDGELVIVDETLEPADFTQCVHLLGRVKGCGW